MTQNEQVTPETQQPEENNSQGAAGFSNLYAEFAEEDRALAEAGMSDYAAGLALEDDAQ